MLDGHDEQGQETALLAAARAARAGGRVPRAGGHTLRAWGLVVRAGGGPKAAMMVSNCSLHSGRSRGPKNLSA